LPTLRLEECLLSLNIVMSISPNMLEVFGMEARAVLTEMEDRFPQVTPSPEDSIEKIMYRSGQRSVVEWLVNRLNEND
jgi:hypothetical protein